MNIADLLAPDRVLILEQQTDKARLLQMLAERAAAALGVDALELTTALLQREGLGSTGMGSGIAIPHARLAGVSKPLGVLALLRRPIDFEAVDDEPVDIVFMLTMPENATGLAALAAVARALRRGELADFLRRTDGPVGALEVISTRPE
jgi:PTS system nitrogen regulatory IIA component